MNDVDIYHISIHQIDEKLDSGKLIVHASIDLTSETNGNELVLKLYECAGNCAVRLFDALKSNSAQFVPIDTSKGNYYPKFSEIDLQLNPKESISVLFKKINRIQFYGLPTINKYKVYQASILFSGFLNIPGYELRELKENSTLLINKSGILLLKHLTHSDNE
jgi:methionyl-tRNA formyltransferase